MHITRTKVGLVSAAVVAAAALPPGASLATGATPAPQPRREQSACHLPQCGRVQCRRKQPELREFQCGVLLLHGEFQGAYYFREGHGAYTGITGTIFVTVTAGEQGALLPSGKCNLDANAPVLGFELIVTGSGKVSF